VRLLALVAGLGLASAALAAGCRDLPYVLESPAGVLGGEVMSYRAGELVFERACAELEELGFVAGRVVYRKAEGRLLAQDAEGEIAGWRFRAERLWADGERVGLEGAELSRGRIRVRAREVVVEGGAARLRDLEVAAPGYRLRAREGTVTRDRLVAVAVVATPCESGEALALAGRRAVFDVESGLLVFSESELDFHGVCLARPGELSFATDRPLDLSFPLRLDLSRGLTLGVEGLPLPEPGRPVNLWRNRLTLLGKELFTDTPSLSLGLSSPEGGFGVEVGPGGFSGSLWGPGFRSELREDGRGFLELRHGPAPGVGTFAVLVDGGSDWLVLGGELRTKARVPLAGGDLSLSAGATLAAPLGADPWAQLGGGARFRRGEFEAGVELGFHLGEPASFWGRERVSDRLTARARLGELGFSLLVEPGRVSSGLSYSGPVSLRADYGEFEDVRRLELGLGYRSPPPAPGGFSYAVRLGYDLLLGSWSRAEATLGYSDGCFVYQVSTWYRPAPWPDEAGGFGASLGMRLR